MLESTMQDFPLTIGMIFRHGRTVYGDSEVVTFQGDGCRRVKFAEAAGRAGQLAGALRRLGIEAGDRVGTFQWNNQEHLEGYLAIPNMGAVLHTLNIRLFPELLSYVVNHAEDRVVIVDDSLIPLLARVASDLKTVEHYIVVGAGDASALADATAGVDVLRYDELLAAEDPDFSWPDVDELAAAAMCYTSGTTGNPKGVVYSHRSTVLHSMSVNAGIAVGLTEHDRVLPIVPMFHANAWGLPYAAWYAGASFVMPDRFLQAEPLAKLIESERPTVAGAVPTIWSDLYRYSQDHPGLGDARTQPAGRSGVPAPRCRARDNGRDGLARERRPGAQRCRAAHRRRRRQPVAVGRRCRRRDRGPRSVGHRQLLPRSCAREVRRRLAAYRRRRQRRAQRVHPHHRPRQGRHQVGRRVDLDRRAREPPHGAPRCRGGRGHRRARPEVGRAPAGVRRLQGRFVGRCRR